LLVRIKQCTSVEDAKSSYGTKGCLRLTTPRRWSRPRDVATLPSPPQRHGHSDSGATHNCLRYRKRQRNTYTQDAAHRYRLDIPCLLLPALASLTIPERSHTQDHTRPAQQLTNRAETISSTVSTRAPTISHSFTALSHPHTRIVRS